MSQPPKPETPRKPLSRRRHWVFRAAAVLLGLSLFALLEGLCILFGWGRVTNYDDPFVGFSEIHPLFVLSEDGTKYEIPPSRQKFFAPESFAATKSPNTFRIFCLGGSTVQGRPYSTPTAFSTWLELSLSAADPERTWEVVNCGGVSYASYRLAPILQEVLGYQPDLIVLCTGHNEFLEERTYGDIKHATGVESLPLRAASRLRSFNVLRGAVTSLFEQDETPVDAQKTMMPGEVDALLDWHGGLAKYHRDDDGQARIVAHFEHNLRRMVSLAGDAGVPLLLIAPPSNLADSPPFKSEHRRDLSEEDLARWERLVEEARANYRDDLDQGIELLHQALDIDGRYALTQYELGQCLAARSLYADARAAFVRARDEDVCPLRIVSPMQQSLSDIAAATGTPLIDAHALLEQETSTGILGGGQLVDHVHPNFAGHQKIAAAIADEMIRAGWLTPRPDWASRRDAAYERQFQTLDDLYYLHGQRTLDALRAWADGRAEDPPATELE